ncbi:MAG: PilN domain-containing protein [Acidobacteriia bacterium]|nr:PilN domain-containing protein [Terriglobia bacterium]
MIRINLLGERKKSFVTLKAPSGPPKSSLLILMLLLVFVAAAAYLYQRYQMLNRELTTVQAQVIDAQAQKDKKQKLLKEIEGFEKRKSLLEARIAVIDELKRNQLGPIQWLNALSEAVDQSQTVWLLSVGQAEDHMTIEGLSTSLNGVANFVATLKRSSAFTNVSINETAVTSISGMDGYTFSVTMDTKVRNLAAKS